MHIKHIEISGFKSYKEASTTEPFSPQINVVVGPNGAGKSNFFHAIRFVLNDTFTNMRPEERQQLLHEGAGHAVAQAYVEIVFDNTDGRFPVDKDEVRLRRTINKAKDDFQLDRKHITKTEVGNLLESAGFSRANPYYIVQQGKIMSMSAMTDAQRLELLKEIGGTKVYEERRKESLSLMADAEAKKASIEEAMQEMSEKLSALDAERQELAAYQTADKDRKALEYALLDRQLTKAKAGLEQAEADGQKLRAELAQAGGTGGEAEVSRLQEEARTAKDNATNMSRRAGTAKKKLQEMTAQRTSLEADITDYEEQVRRVSRAADSSQEEVNRVEEQVGQAQGQLQQAEAALAKARQEQGEVESRLSQAEARQRTLMAKQGGAKQYASVGERDAALNKQISTLEGVLASEQRRKDQLSQQIQELHDKLMGSDMSATQKHGNVSEMEAKVSQADTELRELMRQRDAAAEARKESWRIDSNFKDRIDQLEAEQRARQQAFNSTMAREIAEGTNNLFKLVRDHGVTGVAGRLIDLIKCPQQLYRAVEVTAGNSMFHVVVDSDDVALRCTRLLQQHKAGRVTFMPLNTLHPQQVAAPTEFGNDVIPLMRKITHDDKYQPAVLQVFGRTLLCKDMDVALAASKAADCNCVTIDGDQVSKQGSLTGGYHDERNSRLMALDTLRAVERELHEQRQAQASAKDAGARHEADVNRLNQQVNQKNSERHRLQEAVRDAKRQVATADNERTSTLRQVGEAEQAIATITSKLPALEAQLASLRAQLGTPLSSTLSASEQKEIEQLRETLKGAKSVKQKAAKAVTAAEAQVSKVSSLLNDVLLPRQAELARQDSEQQLQEARSQLELAKQRLEALLPALTSAEKASKEAGKGADEAQAAATAAQQAADAAVDAAAQRQAQDAEGARALEELAGRRAQLSATIEDLSRRIRELGALPSDAFDKCRNKSTKELQRALTAANQSLAALGGVNRQALDQYTTFTERRKELEQRKKEMDVSEAKIRELIATLDARKNEAIERTFKGVAKHFREVFAELVPGGKGELVMQKRHPTAGVGAAAAGDAGDDEDADVVAGRDNNNAGGVLERYNGVKVRVAFTTGGETMSLKQLSGGQKTLVALALIFAIQIDAALDPQYRTTVARLLRKQASDSRGPTQFIVTTFHPQIVQEADRWYGVAHKNRVSSLFAITMEDALTFLQDAEKQTAAAAQAQEEPRGAAGASEAGRAAGAKRKTGSAGPSRARQQEEGEEEEAAMEVDE